MGARNFHFFRMGRIPQLVNSFSLIEKKVLIIALTTALLTGSFLITDRYLGATEAAPDFGGKYTEGIVGEIRFLNPVLAPANNADTDLTRIIYPGLLRFNANQQLEPDLAEALPTLSEDQKQYSLTLRSGLTWHDGQPITADDIIFTIQLIQDPNFASPLRLNWNRVEVNKVDDRTVTFSLREPSAPFIVSLTQGLLPKHIWEGIEPSKFALSKFNLEPVGAGPFMVSEIKKSENGGILSILLSAFPGYVRGQPYLSEIEFKFYQSYDQLIAAYHGNDILGLGYIPFDRQQYVEKSSRIEQYTLNLPQYQALFFNPNKSPVLADGNVRSALAQGINKREIITQVYQGLALESYGPIPPGYLGYNPGVEQANLYNLENAKKLLADTGFVPRPGSDVLYKGDIPLEFTITTNNFPLNQQTAEILKKQWETLGFKVNVQVLTIGELEQNYLRPREYQALLFSENVGADPDPYFFWHSSQRTDPGLNLAMLNNREVDNLLAEARLNADPEYRAPRYLRFQEIITTEVPAVFITNSVFVYGVNEKVRGIELSNVINQSERFLDIHKWYIETKRTVKDN